MAAYFQDDHADALRNDPALTAAVGKETLASQPTLSRFHNRLDENTLAQLGEMLRTIRSRAYSVEMPEHVLFDLDSTLSQRSANKKAVHSIFIIRQMDIILCSVLTE